VALVAIPALAVGRALFGAQFAREMWIDPTTSTTGSPRSLLSCSMPSVRVRTGQPRRARPGPGDHPVTGALSMNAIIGDVTNRNRPGSGSVPIVA
jgi:hypothetical protein